LIIAVTIALVLTLLARQYQHGVAGRNEAVTVEQPRFRI
jgi:hypothetical protein